MTTLQRSAAGLCARLLLLSVICPAALPVLLAVMLEIYKERHCL